MKRARRHAGYTIIETMIFLVISSALIASATILFDGRVRLAQFNQSTLEYEAFLRSEISKVASGTYPNLRNFLCTASPSGPVLATSATATGQGTRTDCVFLGKVIHPVIFSSAAPPATSFCIEDAGRIKSNSLCVLTIASPVVGLRSSTASLSDVNTSFMTAKPITANSRTPIDLSNSTKLTYGLHVYKMQMADTGENISAFALLQTSSGSYGGADNQLSSGASNVVLVPIANSGPVSTQEQIDNLIKDPATNMANVNPPGGIYLCLLNGRAPQRATIAIGDHNGSLITTTYLGQDKCV